MNKSPEEILDIENYWSTYGDIRVNEKDGVAYYKNNRRPQRRVHNGRIRQAEESDGEIKCWHCRLERRIKG